MNSEITAFTPPAAKHTMFCTKYGQQNQRWYLNIPLWSPNWVALYSVKFHLVNRHTSSTERCHMIACIGQDFMHKWHTH